MKKIKGIFVIAAYFAAFFAMTGCDDRNTVVSNTSETGNAMLQGTLVLEGGAPYSGGVVKLITVDNAPTTELKKTKSIIAQTKSDESGKFALDNLPAGKYNLFGNGNGVFVFIDSIEVTVDVHKDLKQCVLKKPGSLHGIVQLEDGGNSKIVDIYLFGTDFLVLPKDSLGNFDLTSIPSGIYSARLRADGFNPKDTVFQIVSGEMDTLRSPIILKRNGLPAIAGLELGYDSLRQSISLKWNRPVSNNVAGYNVYRKYGNTDYWKVGKSNSVDTTYIDSGLFFYHPNLSYTFKVVAVDNYENEGQALQLKSVSPKTIFHVQDSFPIDADSIDKVFRSKSGKYFIGSGNKLNIYDSRFNKTGSIDSKFLLVPGKSLGNADYSLNIDDNDNIYISQRYWYSDDSNGIYWYKFTSTGIVIDSFRRSGIEISLGNWKNMLNDSIFIADNYNGVYLISKSFDIIDSILKPSNTGSSFIGAANNKFYFTNGYYGEILTKDLNDNIVNNQYYPIIQMMPGSSTYSGSLQFLGSMVYNSRYVTEENRGYSYMGVVGFSLDGSIKFKHSFEYEGTIKFFAPISEKEFVVVFSGTQGSYALVYGLD